MDFTCLTPDALDAVADPLRPVVEERLRVAPPGLGVDPGHPGPPEERVIYGTPYANHVETEHFTINWERGLAYGGGAERAGEALEAAWTYFVDEAGWTPPVSSDRYYLWVLLVDDLDGTGLTTEYYTEEYPEGFPVIFLNGSWAPDEPFWESLTIHEFHHTLQYAVRDYDGEGAVESWYWEASATWAASLVVPDSAAVDYIAPWYGDQADLAYLSTEGSHQYGMYVFNAWLDTDGVGPGTMQAAWDAGAVDQDADWRTLLERASGVPAATLWSGFAGAYGNDTYGRSAAWQDPVVVEIQAGGSWSGSADELGTVYYRATEPLVAEGHWTHGSDPSAATGSGPFGIADGPWTLAAGDTLALTTTTGTLCGWSLTTTSLDGDTGDTGEPEDSGDTGRADDSEAGEGEPQACACDGTGGGGLATSVWVAGWVWAQSRRRWPGGAPHAQRPSPPAAGT